jgi:hypothetical protein
MNESGQVQVMTVARVLAPEEDLVEVTFYESARFYEVPRGTPAFDSILTVLKNAQANGKPVRVHLAPDSDNVIESVEQVE